MATDFKPAQEQVNESKRAMLEAMAKHGSAGKARFEEARGNINTAQQEAVQRALQSQLGGPAGTRGFEDVYGRNLASLASLQAGSEQNLADHSAANSSYFDKISGALPIVQARMDEGIAKDRADLERELAIRQQGIEGAISAQEKANEAARLQAEQEAMIEAQERAEERAFREEERAFKRAESEQKAAEKGLPSLDELLGAANMYKQEQREAVRTTPKGGLGRLLGRVGNFGEAVRPIQDVASDLGRMAGVPEQDLYGLHSPQKLSSVGSAQQRLAPPTPVDTKNIMSWANTDAKTAQTIAKDEDYTSAREAAYEALMAPLDADGLIAVGPYAGTMTPWEAYVAQLNKNLPKHKTRTYAALLSEFSPMFSASKAR